MRKITVYTARKIYTMDPGRPVAQAVAVLDGKVLSTGTLESMQPWLERNEHVIDRSLDDKVVLPGFTDPHTHLFISSAFMALHYVGPIESMGPQGLNPGLTTADAVRKKIRSVHLSEADTSLPMVFWGIDPALQQIQLHRDDLDEIVGDRPVWVISYAPHFVYTNSAAIRCVGIPEDCDVHGVMHYSDGRLQGVFVEIAAQRVALGAMQREVSKHGGAAGLKRMARIAVQAGVTTTAEMVFGATDAAVEWRAHEEAFQDLAFPIRMALTPQEFAFHRTHSDRAVDAIEELSKRNTEKLFFHGVKFISDGSLPAMSLRAGFPGFLDGGNGIRSDVPWDELADRMLPFWERGIQIHCHANGDEAVDATLDALEALQARRPRTDHRFTIEHYCISNTMQARRLKALGGLASVNNYFVHYRSQVHANAGYGPDRSEAIARLGSLEREGVIFALHSDSWLVTVPLHPLTAVWCAVNRIARDGKTILAPGERIGVERAFRAVTIDAAYVLGKEDVLGSLEPGKFADFSILEEDPFEVPPEAIRDIKVWGTALSGVLQPA